MSALTIERSTILAKARRTVDAAVAAGRELSEAEQASVESALTRVKAIDAGGTSASLFQRVMSLGTADYDPEAPGVFSDEAKAGIAHAIKSRTSYRTTVDAKALLTTGGLLPTSGEAVAPGLHPNVAPLSSLFRQEQAESAIVRYYRMTAGTAAVVAEGAAKPDAGIGVLPVDLTLEKIAATCQISDEADADAPFIVGQVAAELQAAVAQAENARLLAAFAATSGILTGSGTTATVVDLIADAIAGQEAISGLTPTAVIANPTVVATIRKSKASSAGTYMLDPTQPGPSTIFGVPVYSTPATAAATAWVVERSGVAVYRRGGLTVDVGTNADDFQKNLRTLRAEERVGTAVMRPSCLTKLTLS